MSTSKLTKSILPVRAARYAMCCCVVLLLLGGGCTTSRGTTGNRHSERYVQTLAFDASVPFPRQGVYAWYPPNEQRNRRAVDEHGLILDALEAGFRKQGFVLSPGTRKLSFFIAYYFVRGEETDDPALNANYRWGGVDRWFPGAKTPHSYARRTLVVDVVCAVDRCPRWRCSVQVAVPEDMGAVEKQNLLNHVAERITRNMPPKGTRSLNSRSP